MNSLKSMNRATLFIITPWILKIGNYDTDFNLKLFNGEILKICSIRNSQLSRVTRIVPHIFREINFSCFLTFSTYFYHPKNRQIVYLFTWKMFLTISPKSRTASKVLLFNASSIPSNDIALAFYLKLDLVCHD